MDKDKLEYINNLIEARVNLNNANNLFIDMHTESKEETHINENILQASALIDEELENRGVNVDEYFISYKLIVNGETINQGG
jgi:hypothetical protein